LIRNLIVSAAGSFGSTSIPSNNSFRLRRVHDWVYALKCIGNAFAAVAALPGQQHVLAAALPAAEVQRVMAQQAQLLVEAEQLRLTIYDDIPFHIRSQASIADVTWDGLAQALDDEAERGSYQCWSC